MRAFWAVLGILMLAAALYLFIGGNRTTSVPADDARTQRSAAPSPAPPPTTIAERPAPPSPQPETREAPEAPEAPAETATTAEEPQPHTAPQQAEAAGEEPVVTSGDDAQEGEPATPQIDVAQKALDAEALLAELQVQRGDSAAARLERMWMGELHDEVSRTWDSQRDAREVARDAVQRESTWRIAYMEVLRERIAQRLREEGLEGDELRAQTEEMMISAEDRVVEGVIAGVVARREAAEKLAGKRAGQPADAPVQAPTTHAEAPDPRAVPDPDPDPQESAAKPEAEPASTPESEKPSAGGDDWLVKRDDGTMIADGRYTIRGKGTSEEPYQISWEHLISAEEEYVPRQGREEIPRRIQMLHGKHVEITGYIAFPLLMDMADELLVMLNQWDGCCLGMPPTPYDAVEVRLKDMISGNARMASYGTVRGKFLVEPHLVGGWLVGLYLMEDATLKPLAYGGFAP